MTAQERLERLFDDHAVAVRTYLYRRLAGGSGADATADDLTSEVFIVTWRRIDDVPADAELPWLYAVARRVLANHRRGRTDIAVADLGTLDAIDESDPGVLVCDDAVLAAAWTRLSARDREVLCLSVWEGLSGDALGAALGIGAGGAGAALSRARGRFLEELATEESRV